MSPAFSCDHCGARVELHASQCPSCGKLFDAVRCPKCGHQGAASAFEKGCPKCHYLAPVRPLAPRSRSLFGPAMTVLLLLLAAAIAVAWFLRGS